ncbi:MAG: prepilin-type N-terminal cleavage/methylation domain-containing protein [Planctomycetes bacterium]|nr:prepilin-type N-terminal cleavage/methylation domain-containing protein [Planctomycetota bacterium]
MKTKKGFTLIELLVVIAIIAVLLAILIPSLQAAKELASGAVCVNNQKSLCTAWGMYSADWKGNLVGGSTYDTGTRCTPYRWVEPPLINPFYGSAKTPLTAAALTQDQRLNGIRAGKLFSYIGSEKAYHCPGDKTFRNPEPYAVYRSYAITGLMNGEDFISRKAPGTQFDPIEVYRTVTLNGVNKVLICVTKVTEIASPGTKLVFMEEDIVKGKSGANKQEYNKGGWVLLGNGYTWWDSPAGYHNGGSTFSYADGHADKRKWQDKDTVNKIENAVDDPDPSHNEDLLWLAQGYIPKP